MKNPILRGARLVGALAAIMAMPAFRSLEAAVLPAKERITVMISVDGFPWWLWEDPTLPVPTLRRLAAEGVASRMKVSNPSITWINHTTLVTGVHPAKHGVLYNGLLVRQGPTQPTKIEPCRSKAELVHVPTVYDRAFEAGLTTAQIDWVAITNAPTITWNWFEVPDTNGELGKELVAQGVLSAQELAEFIKGKNVAWRDMVWTKAAAHLIKTRRPNLLLFHPLNTDNINHQYGPGTWASYTAYGYVDRLIGEVLAALQQAGMEDKATVFIVTDHGFKKVSKVILPNVVLRKAGLVRAAGPTVSSCDAYVMAQGGMSFVYVTDKQRPGELVSRLKEIFAKQEGVARVVEPKDYAALGMPTPEMNDGAGDLVIFAKSGYAFQQGAAGEREIVPASEVNYLGTHGYPNTDPELDGVFLAWGYGIKGGGRLPRMENIDVAPTVAELLGGKLGRKS